MTALQHVSSNDDASLLCSPATVLRPTCLLAIARMTTPSMIWIPARYSNTANYHTPQNQRDLEPLCHQWIWLPHPGGRMLHKRHQHHWAYPQIRNSQWSLEGWCVHTLHLHLKNREKGTQLHPNKSGEKSHQLLWWCWNQHKHITPYQNILQYYHFYPECVISEHHPCKLLPHDTSQTTKVNQTQT